ncbi:protein terminal ear1 homolog [Beta vulgaris subsp. vulgaris]|uniref:protein terminal ear1 homolog n=1 Tax=Beta vulgaris subsp. vulgaris TaxID=3555 RepID=UPI0020375C58|nr:protein terminal ear1 homolog [Beta vulgaris subsp. vulgaris]
MQPQSQLGHSTAPPLPAHLSPNPSQVRPKTQSSGPEDGARTRRLVDSAGSSSSSVNYEKKEGYACNVRSSFGGERKFQKQIFMNVKPNGTKTTAMIRNIPNQYTRDMLIKFLDEFCQRENQNMEPNDDHQPFAFDFVYLPMDFKRDANKGYAFVNFTHPIAVWKLHLACSNQRWEHCKSPKICRINYASIQGYEKLVEHFGRSRFVCNHEDYLPLCFNPPRDGSGDSVAETTIGKRFSSSSYLARNSSNPIRSETDRSMN